MATTRVLALNDKGTLTYCRCPPELRGTGRCNHIAHQEEGESPAEFTERVSKLMEEGLQRQVQKPEKRWIPLEGTTVVTKPYRMTEEERSKLTKIENRMQLDMNLDGGYMELEEPLWNDMDKNYYCQMSGMSKKQLDQILHEEAYLITEGYGRYAAGKVISADVVKKWDKEGYPAGWDDSIKMGTGVECMNQWAKQEHGFEATRYVYVLPYWMRMGIADHTKDYGTSSSEDGAISDGKEDLVSSDITLAYKYMLRQHAYPNRQQLAYDALLDNSSLSENYARYSNGYRNRSLADEFAGKGGVFRAVMSGSSIPYTGRGVATANSDVKFGELGIPAGMAIDIFRPTILKRLAQEGRTDEEIWRFMDQFRRPQASIPVESKRELERLIADRRVAMGRQPSLHKPSLQSYRPRISRGAAVEVNPLICKGYNLDFDGDEVGIYAFNNDGIIPVVDRSLSATLDSNTRLPRHQATKINMPTKEAMFGLLSILSRRSES